MRPLPILSMLLLLALATPAAAGSRMLPQPTPEPLGVLVRNSRRIHVLTVEAVKAEGVTFKTKAALKGKADEASFGLLELMSDLKEDDLFRAGDTVICFCRGDMTHKYGGAEGILYVKGRWVIVVGPDAGRGEKNYFCTSVMSEEAFALIYVGTMEALHEAVAALVAGRETTIIARAPVPWNARGIGRLWRIKAGPAVTKFVLSDDSPHFVGWGTGDPEEEAKLVRALHADAARERILAAKDLAHFGATRAALPDLRRVLKDSDPGVRLAAAAALMRLDPNDKDGIDAIQGGLNSANPEARYTTVRTLRDLGPVAGAALPGLQKALTDEHQIIRAAAGEAVGRVAQASPSKTGAVAALTALFKEVNPNDDIQRSTVCALRCLGPQSWESVPALQKLLSTPRHSSSWPGPDIESMDFLAQFDPPPVESLAELLANRSPMHDGRAAAARHLGLLGPRARLALPVLRRVLQDTEERQEDSSRGSIRLDAARAILDIDPKDGPAQVTPVLLELTKERSSGPPWAFYLLARCGPAAKASVPTLLAQLDADDYFTRYAVRDLTNLLGPEDRKLLPTVQRLLSDEANGIGLANVLFRLGEKEKALAHATSCVEKNEERSERVAAARWLGERGREAKVAEPAVQRGLEKASGAERARLALTLWRLRGAEGTEVQHRALAALADLLSVCEGARPEIDRFAAGAFFQPECSGWEESEAVGAAVATVLDRLRGEDDTVTLLSRGLRDSDPYVRLATAVALARAKPDHADTVPALRKLLERHPHFLCYSVDTLTALGPTAAPLAPLVQPLLRHPNKDVSRTAGLVLHRLDPSLAAKGWGAAGAPGAVPDNLVPLWDDLTTDDALRADLAVWRLAGAGSRTVRLLRERLRPPLALSAERLARLIADLDNDAFATRQGASSDLAEAIESAAPALRKALADKPTAEVRRSIQALLDGLDPTRDPEQRRRLRAVRLLEEMGGAEARAVLESLSRGDVRFALTREAKAALLQLDRP